ncbi:peptidoglycan DD-metalloendopeptidase family protein [Blochmannia endosymbiont of Colobopsis nipponica]|nr:peptidoglycan DD-metalloendopeptidase family protein [Blochmannia endosymbiont of Colobopsis nipponica]
MYLNYKLLSVCRQINNYVSLIMNIVYFPLSFFKKEIIKLKNDSFYIRYSKDIFFIYLIPIKKVSFFIQDKDCIVPQNVSKKAGVIDKVFYCSDNPPITNIHKWCWPAHGKIIDYFSSNEIGNKGIDISGFLGQPVLATTAGKVIYAGSALRGYGNLVIIQHNNDWLSAYAHNDTILVNDQEKVQVGQKIATMGSTETDLVKLHFEIRYKGKSVNPLCYLP